MANFTTRFWAKVEKTETCWNWTSTIGRDGYGKLSFNGKYALAHRIAYEMSGAVIPAGMDIDHIC